MKISPETLDYWQYLLNHSIVLPTSKFQIQSAGSYAANLLQAFCSLVYTAQWHRSTCRNSIAGRLLIHLLRLSVQLCLPQVSASSSCADCLFFSSVPFTPTFLIYVCLQLLASIYCAGIACSLASGLCRQDFAEQISPGV